MRADASARRPAVAAAAPTLEPYDHLAATASPVPSDATGEPCPVAPPMLAVDVR